MSIIQKNFEQKLNDVNIPFNYQEIEGGHHLYRFQYQISKSKNLMVEIIVQESGDPYVDGQIIYRHVHLLNDRAEEQKALQVINDLNGMRTGYYNLHLAGDGEIFLRTLVRMGDNPEPFYDTIVMGSAISRGVIQTLQEQLDA